MGINTLTAFVNAKRRRATVNLRVQDKNDNTPEFLFNATYNRFIPRKYLATVTELTRKGTGNSETYSTGWVILWDSGFSLLDNCQMGF